MNTARSLTTMWAALAPLLLIGMWLVYLARHNLIAALSRLVFTAYLMVLTSLLLSPNPIALYHLNSFLSRIPERGVHLCFFAMLAILACSCRFHTRWYILVGVLIVYGLAMEALQYLVPPRCVDIFDYTENVLGILVGCILWWSGQRLLRRKAQ